MQTQPNGSALAESSSPAIHRVSCDEFAAAEAIGVSVHYLRKDRRTKKLIPFYRLGDRVLYNLDRVREAMLSLEEGGGRLHRGKRGAS